MQNVHATPRYTRAIAAVADLLSRLRIEFMFVGSVGRSAWLGSKVDRGSLDVIALMSPEQKNQVAMMASNRGFRVERAEIEQSEELDLVPINFRDADGDVRVHVLLASNALYGRMVPKGVNAVIPSAVEREESPSDGAGSRPSDPDSSPSSSLGMTIKVAAPEDMALLLALSEDPDSQRAVEMLIRLPEFDRSAYNRRLVSIGLPQMVIAE